MNKLLISALVIIVVLAFFLFPGVNITGAAKGITTSVDSDVIDETSLSKQIISEEAAFKPETKELTILKLVSVVVLLGLLIWLLMKFFCLKKHKRKVPVVAKVTKKVAKKPVRKKAAKKTVKKKPRKKATKKKARKATKKRSTRRK